MTVGELGPRVRLVLCVVVQRCVVCVLHEVSRIAAAVAPDGRHARYNAEPSLMRVAVRTSVAVRADVVPGSSADVVRGSSADVARGSARGCVHASEQAVANVFERPTPIGG